MDDLILHRLASAKDRLISAKLLLEAGQYKDSIGRSYYAIFSSLRAVLAKDRVDYSKHAGVISYFQKEYVKSGVFDKKYSRYITMAFQIRNNCDYDDFYIVSKEDAETQYAQAEELYDVIERYLKDLE